MDKMTAVRHAPRAVQGPDTDLLFQPYRLGPFNLPHRIVMAPLTRSRACQPGNVPCVDGSGLARTFFTFCSIGRCSHVSGLLMRFT